MICAKLIFSIQADSPGVPSNFPFNFRTRQFGNEANFLLQTRLRGATHTAPQGRTARTALVVSAMYADGKRHVPFAVRVHGNHGNQIRQPDPLGYCRAPDPDAGNSDTDPCLDIAGPPDPDAGNSDTDPCLDIAGNSDTGSHHGHQSVNLICQSRNPDPAWLPRIQSDHLGLS